MQIDITAVLTVLATTGILGSLGVAFKAAWRHWSGRERREQLSIRELKAERDAEWRRRITLGDAYARVRRLAIDAGADPAELALTDRLITGLNEGDNQ